MNSDNHQDNHQDKQEPIKKINKDNDNKKSGVPVPTTTFKLPITFVEKNKLHKLDEHILTDLELVNCNNIHDDANGTADPDTKPKTMYEHIFNPKTIYGKQFLENWATYYTSDVSFLKQTQTLIKKFSPPHHNDDNYDNYDEIKKEPNVEQQYSDIHAIWNSIQNDKNFKDKYGYVYIGLLEPLN